MNWMQDLDRRLQARELFQISIDSHIYTVDARRDQITFTNEHGRTETFSSPELLETALQSWYENPIIILL